MIARFGSGAAAVDVREVAAGGAQLASEHAALVSAGRVLLRDRNIQASSAARPALLAGRVDPRLLANLSVLAAQMPIRLVAFDDLSPGADASVPLRGAEIGAVSPGASPVILSFLRAQQGAYAPSVATQPATPRLRPGHRVVPGAGPGRYRTALTSTDKVPHADPRTCDRSRWAWPPVSSSSPPA